MKKSKYKASDKVDGQHVGRVEAVEGIFGNFRFYTPLPIIHVNQAERNENHDGKRNNDGADDRLQSLFISKGVHKHDESETSGTIVNFEKVCSKGQGSDGADSKIYVIFEEIEAPDTQETQQQSKHYILVFEGNRTVKHQVERHLRDQAEQKKVEGILFLIVGVNISFCQKESENWESKSAQINKRLNGFQTHVKVKFAVSKQQVLCNMVNQHCGTGNDFEHCSV